MMEGNLSLRIILLIIGALVIAGVFVWGVIQQRRGAYAPGRRPRAQPAGFRFGRAAKTPPPEEEDEDDDLEPEPVGDRISDLTDLRGLVADDGLYDLEDEEPVAPAKQEPKSKTKARSQPTKRGQEPMPALKRAQAPQAPEGKAPQPQQREIITLEIMAQDGGAFHGKTVLHKFQGVGLHYGDMNIFHHYGMGGHQAGSRAVFSLANMFEPGVFDLDDMRTDAFRSRGFVLFLQLPGPLDGSVALELLLSAAQRLAGDLGGVVLNERRELLGASDLERMRKAAASFTQGRS
jgi:cell division protein ZipA